MDEEKHWDKIGEHYNNQIFDVFKSDRNKILQRYFKKHANLRHTAIDFGCGTGKSFEYIAPVFKNIIAVDISRQLLSQAAQRGYKNVSFKQLDLTRKNLSLPEVHFVFCCNVAMLPEIAKTHAMIANIKRVLKKNGTALVVLPSLDSVLYSAWRLIEVYKKEGVQVDDIPEAEFAYFNASKRKIIEGIIHIDNVPTKHFMQPELEVVFRNAGLTITAIEKVEYNWDTELAEPPAWLKDPYPWDWLVVCKRES